MMEEMLKNQEAAKNAVVNGEAHPNGTAMPADASHAAMAVNIPSDERRPALNEVGSPSALQARRAGPHPQLESGAGTTPDA
jgi:hypothetical protein